MQISQEDWLRIKELFLLAIEKAPDQQREILDSAGLDPSLRECMDELLHAHDQAGSFLEPHLLQTPNSSNALAVPPLPSSSSSTVQHHASFEPGALLAGRFRVIAFLAHGGMGEVYEVEDQELKTRVAIKTIRPEILGLPQSVDRFRREVQLSRRVTHPNVCRIHDLFRHSSGHRGEPDFLLVSMELLQGRTLASVLRERGALDPHEALAILRQVTDALAAAHEAGIIHRDLKPSNIFLEAHDASGPRAVVTDFGLAVRAHTMSNDPLTRSGQAIFGTPEYMSPEQIEGRELTPASDIYALGLILFQMLTGRHAFESRSQMLSALKRLTDEPPLPSSYAPSLPRAWDALLRQCLARDPEKRIGSAAQLRQAIAQLEREEWQPKSHSQRNPAKLAGGGSSTQPPSVAQDRPAVRHGSRAASASSIWRSRWMLGVGAMACLVALLLGGYRHHLHSQIPSDSQAPVVMADFVNTTGDSEFDDALNTALEAKLQQSPYLNLMPPQKIVQALRYMGLDHHERLTLHVALQICQRENGSAVIQGSIRINGQGYEVGIQAYHCSNGAVVFARSQQVGNRDTVLSVLDQVADATRSGLGESLESIRRFDVPLDEATTPSLDALSAYSQGNRKWNEQGEAAAIPYFQKATELDPNFAMAYARLGTILGNMGETRRSDIALTRAYELRDRISEWERFYVVSHYYGLVTGQLDKEAETYEQWGKIYPHDMAWPVNLGLDYAMSGQFEKALAMNLLVMRELPGLSPVYGNLGQIYLALHRSDEAKTLLDAAARANLHDVNIQLVRYQLAFYDGDAAAMTRVLQDAAAIPGAEDTILSQESDTSAYYGRLKQARQLADKAAAIASHAGNLETAAEWSTRERLWEAEFGSRSAVDANIEHAIALFKGQDERVVGAMALVVSGNTDRAEFLANTLAQDYPLDTMVHQYWVPLIHAWAAYQRRQYPAATQWLKPTTSYAIGIYQPLQCMDSTYLAGLIDMARQQQDAAIAQFQSLLAQRGVVLNCPTGTLAMLGLARALAARGELQDSRKTYQDLFVLWQDADPGIPLVEKARKEYQALP